MRSGRDSNPRIAVLQTAVLPLHHRTLERTYSRQWIANLQSLIGYSRAGLGQIIVLPLHHQADEEQYTTKIPLIKRFYLYAYSRDWGIRLMPLCLISCINDRGVSGEHARVCRMVPD